MIGNNDEFKKKLLKEFCHVSLMKVSKNNIYFLQNTYFIHDQGHEHRR